MAVRSRLPAITPLHEPRTTVINPSHQSPSPNIVPSDQAALRRLISPVALGREQDTVLYTALIKQARPLYGMYVTLN